MLIESANVKISNFPILFKQNSPPKQHIFSFIKKKSVSSFSRTLIKSTPARFESRARAGKERSHHVSNGTFFDWSLFVSTSDAFLSHSSGFRDLCWIRRIRFPINISPNASLFSNLQCAKRMMRANAGRHHGATVGLLSHDSSHVWVIVVVLFDVLVIHRARTRSPRRNTRKRSRILFLSPRLTKKCTFFLLPQPKRHRRSLRSAVGFRERFSPPGLQTRRER